MTDEPTLDVGRNALELADEAIDFASELRTEARRLDGGTTVIDLGVEARGSLDAGLLFASVRRGGLVAAEIRVETIGHHTWPVLEAMTAHPTTARELATTESIAEWSVAGPGVAGYVDPFAVATVTGDAPIDDAAAETIADALDIDPSDLYLLSTSVGSTSWRVDDAMATLEAATTAVGDDTDEVALSAPLPPRMTDVDEALERATACRTLGASVHLQVTMEDPPGEVTLAGADMPAKLTIADASGTVTTVGETDRPRLGAELEG